ncbi:hypothetical protein DFH06DRAFT_1123509 [Mycena polygramma]|nr:hypothetical protein DFH06DRAFT_1123509 [Mycena polygramma]
MFLTKLPLQVSATWVCGPNARLPSQSSELTLAGGGCRLTRCHGMIARRDQSQRRAGDCTLTRSDGGVTAAMLGNSEGVAERDGREESVGGRGWQRGPARWGKRRARLWLTAACLQEFARSKQVADNYRIWRLRLTRKVPTD